MRHSEWYFSEDKEWDSLNAMTFFANHGASYRDAAEEIAEMLDCSSGYYPDEREFWLLHVSHNTPVRMKVMAEARRIYSAQEMK